MIVGSGGSYVAGLYAKYIIEKNKTNLCEVLKPMEVSQTNMQLYSYAIIYSYKMNNYDIKMAIKCILEASNIKKVFIVTARKINKVYDDRVEYIYYDEDSEYETKYVSYKGIYIPTYMLGSCFENIKIDIEKLKCAKLEVNKDCIIDIFYDKENNCLAQLVERHFCELGISTIRMHEKKDFSHGRMNILEKRGEVIFLSSCNYDEKYDSILLKYLENVYNCKILNKNELDLDVKLDYFEKMLLVLFWIEECSMSSGISMENKKDTKEDEKLFKYGKEEL